MRRFAWLLFLLTTAPAAAEPFAPKLLKEFGTSRFRYPGNVEGSIVSPDGKYVAVRGSADVWVYDFATGRNVWRSRFKDWDSETIQQSCLPVFDSANNLLTVEFNADIWPRIAIYCMKSGQLLRSARIKLSRIRGTFFSPDATLLVVRRSREVIFLDARTGLEVYRLQPPPETTYGYARIVFSPDSRRVAVRWDEDRILVYDRATGSELLNIKRQPSIVGMAFSLDTDRFHALLDSSNVESFDFSSGSRSTSNIPGGCQQILGLQGDRLAGIAPESGQCHLLATAEKRIVRSFRGLPYSFHSGTPSLTPDGQTLIVPRMSSDFGLWDLSSGRQLQHSADGAGSAYDLRFRGESLYLRKSWGEWSRIDIRTGIGQKLLGQDFESTKDLSPDGKRFLNATDRCVFITDSETGRTLLEMKKWRASDRASVQFLDGGRAVGMFDDADIATWNTTQNRTSRVSLFDGEARFEGVISPRGTWFATRPYTTSDKEVFRGRLEIREMPSGRVRARIFHRDSITQTLFTQDESRLLFVTDKLEIGDDHSTVHIVDPATGKCLRRFVMSDVHSKCLSPDGRVFYVLSMGGASGWLNRLQAVEIATGRVRFETPSVEPWIIDGVGCAPDLRRIAVGTSDGLVRIWDTAPEDDAMPPDAAAWDDLRDPDAAKGYAAIRRFAKYPEVALPLLKAKLPPLPVADAMAVEGWLRDLGAPAFRTREAATKNLAASISVARTAMERTLVASPSPEVRERLTALFERETKPRPEAVRAIRSAEIVERILADERTAGETRRVAIELLKGWAGGADGATLTTEAKETLNRMKR